MLGSSPSMRVLNFFALCILTTGVAKAEFLFIGQGASAFQYPFLDFSRTPLSNGGERVFGPTDSGGVGKGYGGSLDLSAYAADGRFQVDLTPQSGNTAGNFLLELIDNNGNGGKWQVSTGGAAPGSSATVVSTGTLSQPTDTIGNFGLFDPSSVNLFQLVGSFSNPSPFDINFNSISVANNVAPPPAYPGAEPNAPWRAVADTRIDAVRKGDLTVRVVDAAGNSISGASVAVLQQEHAFGFGATSEARFLGNNPQSSPTYQTVLRDNFNTSTLGNNLKWAALEGEFGPLFTEQTADEALRWLNLEGFEVRGHTLVWPGVNNMPVSLSSLLTKPSLSASEQQQLRDAIADHINDIVPYAEGRVIAWDVVNEPRTNHDVMDLLDEGDAAMATWFQLARQADPSAKLVLNEWGILSSGGGTNTANQQILENQILALQQQGAPIDGVGFESHFSEGSITGPEQLWQIVDRFDALGVDIEITEYDFDTTDEQLQADYLRDFYTAMFAHEAVDRIVTWEFWEQTPGAQNANKALFRNDWSPKPAALAYQDLVFNQWWTDEQLTTDSSGESALRGFKGIHEVTVTWAGQGYTLSIEIDGNGNILEFALPFVSGDYNGDGNVDAADYTVWRNTLGSTVPIGSGADGNADGVINQADYDLWAQNFGASSSATSRAVPEASTSTLILTAICFLLTPPNIIRSSCLHCNPE